MYVPEDLKKVNEFVDARIPSNRDYFSRFGNCPAAPSAYTGDNVAPMPADKVSQIVAGEASTMNDVRAMAAEVANRQREIEENARLAAEAKAAKAKAQEPNSE